MYQGIGGKMEKVIQENSINMDIVVLIKTKKKKWYRNHRQLHIFSGVPKHQRERRGVSIMIHKKHRRKITSK